jgi:RNA polymerase sigma-70 factor (ECF subfamily)
MTPSLIEKLKSGDESAYRLLFDQYYVPLTSFAFRFTKSSEIAKDVVQNLFIKLYQNRDGLTIQSDLKNYLYKAVYHGSLNELKKENLREEHHLHYVNEHVTPYDHEREETEKEHKIYRAIQQLSPKCRQIFLMSRIEGRKNHEIAAELGLSIRTVETQISQALKSIRKTVDKIYHFLLSL